jgi:hypothetical protein
MVLLIPGRHHLITRFQASYLFRFFNVGMDGETDTAGVALTGRVCKAVFAVTSADHAATRRNPLPFFLRAIAIHELGVEIGADVLAYGIDEAGNREDFAEYTLKTILHESEGELDLRPDNCVVVCATGVGELYERLGFRVWAAESGPSAAESERALPWDIIELIAGDEDWRRDRRVMETVHPASYRLLERYGLDRKIRRIFSNPILGGDGDLTSTRDYGSYVRQMDDNAESKWEETRGYVRAGRIGDIGCAVGSWLQRACRDPRFVNSDFYGIEITRALYDICIQRRHNGDFGTPNIWFAQRDAVEGEVFRASSMTTIHSSSLTHEIESYAGRTALESFIANRFAELEEGGVWINRDVIGPEDGDREVILELTRRDGSNPPEEELAGERERLDPDRDGLTAWLSSLSTAARFLAFAKDFRAKEGYRMAYEVLPDASAEPSAALRLSLRLRDACEYLLTKDYCDNWQSEMHETFCHWSLSDWRAALSKAGFRVSDSSRAWTNPWIVEKRWLGAASLFDPSGAPLPWPPTNAVIAAYRG